MKHDRRSDDSELGGLGASSSLSPQECVDQAGARCPAGSAPTSVGSGLEHPPEAFDVQSDEHDCLPGDARVMVQGLGVAPLRQCVSTAGDLALLGFDHDRGEAEFRRVTAASSKVVRRRFVTLGIQRGSRILRLRLTQDHRVFVLGRGYVPAREVCPGEHVIALTHYYPCAHCDAAFDVPAAIGGHLRRAHQLHHALAAAPGRNARWCCGRHAATKRLTSRRPADCGSSDRPRRDGRPDGRRLLLARLGQGWAWQYGVPTHACNAKGMPSHYKFDLAHAEARVGIHVVGRRYRVARDDERDARKLTWLTEHGWLCLHLRDDQVCSDPDAVAASVLEVMRCRL